MKRTNLIAAFIVMLFALAACGGPVAKLEQVDNGATIDLKTGETFTVTLEGNPTTGYSWEVAEIDPAIIELAGEPDYKSDSMLIGSGGVFKFTFVAVGAGTSRVKLIYHRPWEEDVEPLEIFEVQANVK